MALGYAKALRAIGSKERSLDILSKAYRANPDNGQREALWAALEHDFYGTPVRSDALRPDAIEPGAIFALRRDERLDLALPPEIWDRHLTVLHPGYGSLIARFEEDAQ